MGSATTWWVLMVSFSKVRILRQSRRSSSSILGNLEVPVEALGSPRLQPNRWQRCKTTCFARMKDFLAALVPTHVF